MRVFRELGVVHALAMLAVLTNACVIFAAETDAKPREPIGEVFGKPVFRDEMMPLKGRELHGEVQRLFLRPVLEQYRSDHAKEIAPTKEEMAAVTAYFNAQHRKRLPEMNEELRQIEEELAKKDLRKSRREELESRREQVKPMLEPHGELIAESLLPNWKFQKHLYDNYGGGRILWQQFGNEAFDAMRLWILAREKAGDFKITDEKLRDLMMEYWTQDHGAFLTDDEQRIRTEFLEPAWLKRSPVE